MDTPELSVTDPDFEGFSDGIVATLIGAADALVDQVRDIVLVRIDDDGRVSQEHVTRARELLEGVGLLIAAATNRRLAIRERYKSPGSKRVDELLAYSYELAFDGMESLLELHKDYVAQFMLTDGDTYLHAGGFQDRFELLGELLQIVGCAQADYPDRFEGWGGRAALEALKNLAVSIPTRAPDGINNEE
jgi:hypothetical protein